jgi:hypothetical protein
MLHSSGPPPSFSSLNSHHDALLMNRNSPLFHPLPLHALPGGHKPPGSGAGGPPPLNFASPFGPSPHDNNALRHLDPLGLRLMNPAAAAAACQLFAAQSHYNASMGRPTPSGFDPTTALLLDPRYRGMIPPFGNSSPSSAAPPSSSNNSSPSASGVNGTHNHSHVHSHSHTHLHLGNNNESSSSSNNSNGPSIAPPPPPPLPPPPPSQMMSFANPLSSKYFQLIDFIIIFISIVGLSHGGPLLHSGGPPPPPSSMSSLEAMHNLSRERELMAFMFANSGGRFDPMAMALANSFQV